MSGRQGLNLFCFLPSQECYEKCLDDCDFPENNYCDRCRPSCKATSKFARAMSKGTSLSYASNCVLIALIAQITIKIFA